MWASVSGQASRAADLGEVDLIVQANSNIAAMNALPNTSFEAPAKFCGLILSLLVGAAFVCSQDPTNFRMKRNFTPQEPHFEGDGYTYPSAHSRSLLHAQYVMPGAQEFDHGVTTPLSYFEYPKSIRIDDGFDSQTSPFETDDYTYNPPLLRRFLLGLEDVLTDIQHFNYKYSTVFSLSKYTKKVKNEGTTTDQQPTLKENESISNPSAHSRSLLGITDIVFSNIKEKLTPRVDPNKMSFNKKHKDSTLGLFHKIDAIKKKQTNSYMNDLHFQLYKKEDDGLFGPELFYESRSAQLKEVRRRLGVNADFMQDIFGNSADI